jgi:hypothetical protein
VTYEEYVTSVADILVDRFNLHPDDAVELIDMNKRDVVRWYGEFSPKVVAHRLMLRLRSWISPAAQENPMTTDLAWWLAGAVTVIGVGYLIANAVLQSKIKQAVPSLQPTNLKSVSLQPYSRQSVSLALTPNGQLLPTINLFFASDATYALTPAEGVITVTPNSSGATVRAVGAGSAMVTVSYPPDTTGLTDAIVSIGVFSD